MSIQRITRRAVWILGLAGGVAACLALSSTSIASAAAQVEIAALDCTSDPEVVELSNTGTDPQDMTGWQLVSDPPQSEAFDLTPIGTLAAGASVFIESGPGAQATFTWSPTEIFRNGDSTDFVRLVDNTGATVAEQACAAQATSTPAPTPEPSAQSATPTAAAADDVPDGGGPPGDAATQLLTPLTAVVAGSSLAGAGLFTFAALWVSELTLRARRQFTSYDPPPPPPPSLPRRDSRPSQRRTEPVLVALIVTLCAAVLLALVTSASSRTK